LIVGWKDSYDLPLAGMTATWGVAGPVEAQPPSASERAPAAARDMDNFNMFEKPALIRLRRECHAQGGENMAELFMDPSSFTICPAA
jgi:hypothetical protein